MKERTDEQVFTKAPIKVKLGEKDVDIRPLSINKARAWREKFLEAMSEVVGSLQVEQSQDSVGPAMTAALLKFPDKMIDLVFAWHPELQTDSVMDETTEEQMAHAFTVIMSFAYPHLAPLAMSVQVTKSR